MVTPTAVIVTIPMTMKNIMVMGIELPAFLDWKRDFMFVVYWAFGSRTDCVRIRSLVNPLLLVSTITIL